MLEISLTSLDLSGPLQQMETETGFETGYNDYGRPEGHGLTFVIESLIWSSRRNILVTPVHTLPPLLFL